MKTDYQKGFSVIQSHPNNMQISIIADMIEWIEANLTQPLSVQAMADHAGYTKWHFQRMFKAVTNQSVYAYVRHRRLTEIALKLPGLSHPVGELAATYGFDNQSAFCRAFREQFDCTASNVINRLSTPKTGHQFKITPRRPRGIHGN